MIYTECSLDISFKQIIFNRVTKPLIPTAVYFDLKMLFFFEHTLIYYDFVFITLLSIVFINMHFSCIWNQTLFNRQNFSLDLWSIQFFEYSFRQNVNIFKFFALRFVCNAFTRIIMTTHNSNTTSWFLSNVIEIIIVTFLCSNIIGLRFISVCHRRISPPTTSRKQIVVLLNFIFLYSTL